VDKAKATSDRMRPGGSKKAHSVGEVHFHGQDADILGAGLRGVGSSAVGVDAVGGGHFEGDREGVEVEEGRMREKEGISDEVLYDQLAQILLVPFSRSYHSKTGNRSVRRTTRSLR